MLIGSILLRVKFGDFRLMMVSYLGRTLLMIGRRVCSLLDHFPAINLSLLLCLRMSNQTGIPSGFVIHLF
jgi:hypothetical protein